MTDTVYAHVDGAIAIIGFGSIGRGVLPLLLRHLHVQPSQITVVAPETTGDDLIRSYGVNKRTEALSPATYKSVLAELFTESGAVRLCVNVSVDTSSVDIMRVCRDMGVLYIDTVIEPWAGFYDNPQLSLAQRTNDALRRTLLAERHASPGGTTAVSACGANPGMVSWLVKQALLDVARRDHPNLPTPSSRAQWAQLMRDTGVKGIHIAERDTQRTATYREPGSFWNTWSVEGFIAEGLQPAELGWGTHEMWWPPQAERIDDDAPGIFLLQPGIVTKVRTWCPSHGAQHGFCVTHNEAISIADYFTVRGSTGVEYRPTCHYAYLPCDDAVMSWHDLLGGGPITSDRHTVLDVADITGGIDELGVLLYGHRHNAYWYGSRLSHDDTVRLAPHQNTTGLQVTSAILAGVVWAIENPVAGIVEADDMDFARCLEIQGPYIGPVGGHYTDWTPLRDTNELFPADVDATDPWQFKNVLVRYSASDRPVTAVHP